MNLWEVLQELSRRLSHIFLRNGDGRRPVFGNSEKFQADERFREYVLLGTLETLGGQTEWMRAGWPLEI